MKILVTGANGFLGRGIVKELANSDAEIIATGFSIDQIDADVKKIECDLFNLDNPFEFFEKPDVVLHLAYRDGFVLNSDAHLENFDKHISFINKMANSGIKQLAVMGTMHEIGFYEGCVNEHTPCNPMNNYGIIKNALRNYSKLICQNHDITFQWLRAYYIVDGTSFGNSIFSKLYAANSKGDTQFPFTTGKNIYDFLDYEDFCSQVSSAILQSKVAGIIEICSGEPIRLSERVERFIKENNLSIKLEYGAFPDRPFDSKAIWADNKKIMKIMKREEQ